MEKNEFPAGRATIAGIDLTRLNRELRETTQNDCDRDPADVANDALTVIAELMANRAGTSGASDIVSSPIVAHDQHQLAAQRDATDAAARAGAVRPIDRSWSVPAKAGTTLEAPADILLHPLEAYAGLVHHHGVPVHLILLPGDVQVTGLDVAEEFVASLNGEFPTYRELEHLRRTMQHRFKPSLYYTCDQEPYDGDMATVLFDFATDTERQAQKGPRNVRARAVRRIPVQGAEVIGGLTEDRVAAIAAQLIDDVSRGYDSDTTDDENIAAAGIKVGIGKMAMAVQQALAAEKRQKGGAS